MKVFYLNQDISSIPALAMMITGEEQRPWSGKGGASNCKGGAGGHMASGAQPAPNRVRWLCFISGSDFKALHRKRVKMGWSLEVSLAPGRPLPRFDEAPSVAGLLINCGHAVCSCRCKSSADTLGLIC